MITFKVPSRQLRFLPMPKYAHPPLWGSERELQASGSASSSGGLHSLQGGVCSAFARLPEASFPRSSRPPAVCRCFHLPVSRCTSSLDRHISSLPGSVLLQASAPVHPSQHLLEHTPEDALPSFLTGKSPILPSKRGLNVVVSEGEMRGETELLW